MVKSVRKSLILVVWTLCSTVLFAQQGDRGKENQNTLPETLKIPPSPALSAEDSMKTMKLADGFQIELVASDPLVQDPVALTFDGNGRLWVCEMRGFMPDVDGTGEDAKVGRINILEDTNGDGNMDKSTIFLDGLHLPRAILLVEGGVLYADQTSLYFVKREGDKAGEVKVIDPNFAEGGNVEHKANGLLPALDNWIYNAKSSARYRYHKGVWVKNHTETRGQWGIAQDDYGRLVHNNNANMLFGELTMPNWPKAPKPYRASNRVYPLRITPGVNRAYRPGTLDKDFKLKNVTAVCGLTVYRGDNFPAEYYGTIMVPEPAANLIKLIKLEEGDFSMKATHFYESHEWLASTDERFRPVNMYTAPDGTAYVIDMYRGILQHKTYLTTYLRNQILSRGLDKVINKGRIYRIVHSSRKPGVQPKMLNETPEQWVQHLRHPNGWWRDKAQHLLVRRQDKSVVRQLERMAWEHENPLAQIHALWTLEGLDALHFQPLAYAMTSANVKVLSAVLRLTKNLPKEEAEQAKAIVDVVARNKSKEITYLLNALPEINVDYKSNFAAKQAEKPPRWVRGKMARKWKAGKKHYEMYCGACHHASGKGVQNTAPPLIKSEWVLGNPEVLSLIILNGVTGPMHVNSTLYKNPDVLEFMPPLKSNPMMTDQVLSDLQNYIRNAWGNKASFINPKQIKKIREKYKDQENPFTEEQLKKIIEAQKKESLSANAEAK